MSSTAIQSDKLDQTNRTIPPFALPKYRSDSQIPELLNSILGYSVNMGDDSTPVIRERSFAEFQCANYKISLRNNAGLALMCYRDVQNEQGRSEKFPIAEYILSRDGTVTGMRIMGQDWVAARNINVAHARELLEQCTPEKKIA